MFARPALRFCCVLVVVTSSLLACPMAWGDPPSVYSLSPTLGGEWSGLTPTCVANDGTVFGWGYNPPLYAEGFLWTAAGGVQLLSGQLGGVPHLIPQAVSADGRYLAGDGLVPVSGTPMWTAFRWDRNGVAPSAIFPAPYSLATSISDDGQVVIGGTGSGDLTFAWQPSELTFFPIVMPGSSTPLTQIARGVSGDGQTVVGHWTNGDGFSRPLVWQAPYIGQEGNAVALSGVPQNQNWEFRSANNGVSTDGSAFVGTLDTGSGSTRIVCAAVVNLSGGLGTLTQLDPLASYVSSQPVGISGNGRFVIGASYPDFGLTNPAATVWNLAAGGQPQSIADLLTGLGASADTLNQWQFQSVTAISSDGNTIAGLGFYQPQGTSDWISTGWVASLPTPPTGTDYLWAANGHTRLFHDGNNWSPVGVPGATDNVLVNIDPNQGTTIYPQGYAAETVIARLTVSGGGVTVLQLESNTLYVRSNGSPGSGMVRVTGGQLFVSHGELQAMDCVVGGETGGAYLTVRSPLDPDYSDRLTLSGDLIAVGGGVEVGLNGALSARNVYLGDPSPIGDTSFGSLSVWTGGLALVSDTIHVYWDSELNMVGGNVNVGVLHTYKYVDPQQPWNPRLGVVSGWGTITAATVNNEGGISARGGVLDVYGDIVQYSGGMLTGGDWEATNFGTLNLHIGDVTGIGSNSIVKLDGQGTSIPKIANLNYNGGQFVVGQGATFTTVGSFQNAGTLDVWNSYSLLTPSTFTVTGDLDNIGRVNVTGFGLPGGTAAANFIVEGNVAQLQGDTLTGGGWQVVDGTLTFGRGGNVVVNRGDVFLGGANWRFDPILALADNRNSFYLAEANFTTVGSLLNSASLLVDRGHLTVQGDYTQTAGGLQLGPSASEIQGVLEVHGGVFVRGDLSVTLLGNECVGNVPLITFTGANPDIQFTNIGVYYLHANRQWHVYQDATSFGIGFDMAPNQQFHATWVLGMTPPQALPGFSIGIQSTGSVTLVTDPLASGGLALDLMDVATEGTHVVSITTPLHVDDQYLHVSFNWRFLTDGKLKISLDSNQLDVIFSSTDWPDQVDPGRDTFAPYDHWFNLTALGFAEGATADLKFELSNLGDPEFRFDGLTIETSGVPEPCTAVLLALGGMVLARRRRR